MVEECLETERLTVHFNWNNIDSIPESMRVMFWPKDFYLNPKGVTFFDINNNNSFIELPAGNYEVLAWNNDTEHVYTEGYDRITSAYATTGQFSPHGDVKMANVLDSIFHGQSILDYPDYMVHAYCADLSVLPNEDDQFLTLMPDSMVTAIEIRLQGISGLEWCRGIRGGINNVAAKRRMAFDDYTEKPTVIMFDGEWEAKDSLVTAHFWVFGMEPTDMKKIPHKMVFFFWLDGGQVFIPIDISQTMEEVHQDEHHVVIEKSGLDIDLRRFMKDGDTGMKITAEDWENAQYIELSF